MQFGDSVYQWVNETTLPQLADHFSTNSDGGFRWRVYPGGQEKEALRILASGVCDFRLGTCRNAQDQELFTNPPNTQDLACSGIVSGKLLSLTGFDVAHTGNVEARLKSSGGGSALVMQALDQERWVQRVLSSNRWSLGRVTIVSGNRLETDVLTAPYDGGFNILTNTVIGVAGNANSLSVTGNASVAGSLSCGSLTVNGQAPLTSLGNAVLYDVQNLTSTQQILARSNIGACSATDSRLSDARTPIAGSVSDASVASNAAIQQSKISGLTIDLVNRVLKAGDTMTGGLTAPTLTAFQTTAAGGNVTVSATNGLANGFASLYLTAVDSATEQGQLYVGQGSGLVVRTNSSHSIRLAPNNVPSLTLPVGAAANFATTPTANGTALVLTNDSRLTTPYMPLAGGTMTGALNAHAGLSVQGAKGSNSPATPGILLGRDTSGAGNTAIEMTCAVGQLSYLDFGAVNTDYMARIICTPSTSRLDLQCANIGFTGVVSTSGNFTAGGALGGASAAITGNLTASRVQATQQPYCLVHYSDASSAFVTLNGGGVGIKLTFNTVRATRGTAMYSTSTGRFTAPAAGVYLVTLSWMEGTTGKGNEALFSIVYVNGAAYQKFEAPAVNVSLLLAQNDYVELYAGGPSFGGYATMTQGPTCVASMALLS